MHNPFKRAKPLSNLGSGAISTRPKGTVMTHNAGEQGASETEAPTCPNGYTGVIQSVSEDADHFIYVAGPMSGLPEFNYPAFIAAATALRRLGMNVLNPVDAEADNPIYPTPQGWDWYMRSAIRMVTHCNKVALLPGWENSKGANLEHAIATALKADIRPLDQWLS